MSPSLVSAAQSSVFFMISHHSALHHCTAALGWEFVLRARCCPSMHRRQCHVPQSWIAQLAPWRVSNAFCFTKPSHSLKITLLPTWYAAEPTTGPATRSPQDTGHDRAVERTFFFRNKLWAQRWPQSVEHLSPLRQTAPDVFFGESELSR